MPPRVSSSARWARPWPSPRFPRFSTSPPTRSSSRSSAAWRSRGSVVTRAFSVMARSFAAPLAIVMAALFAAPAAAAPADSTAVTFAAPVDSAATARAAASRDSVALGTRIALDESRKQGAGSLEEALRGRRAALLLAAPQFGPLSAPAVLPDAGTRVRPWPLGIAAERSTDRTVIAGFPYSLAIPDLAVAWDDPEGDGFEIQEWRTLDASPAPSPFRTAGALLAAPRAEA